MSQESIHSHSLSDPETFWSHHATRLHWHTKPSRALSQSTQSHQWSWFPDGEISTTYNCVDRHVHAGNGNNVAIIWESPVTGTTEKYTYAQLLEEVEVLAGVLREEGVKRGDVVLIYST
jgi:propionyl-CoA synthetase